MCVKDSTANISYLKEQNFTSGNSTDDDLMPVITRKRVESRVGIGG